MLSGNLLPTRWIFRGNRKQRQRQVFIGKAGQTPPVGIDQADRTLRSRLSCIVLVTLRLKQYQLLAPETVPLLSFLGCSAALVLFDLVFSCLLLSVQIAAEIHLSRLGTG